MRQNRNGCLLPPHIRDRPRVCISPSRQRLQQPAISVGSGVAPIRSERRTDCVPRLTISTKIWAGTSRVEWISMTFPRWVQMRNPSTPNP